MSQYANNIIDQANEVERCLQLPQLQSYEVRSLNGRKKGLQRQTVSSLSVRQEIARRLRIQEARNRVPQPVRVVSRNKRGRVWAEFYE